MKNERSDSASFGGSARSTLLGRFLILVFGLALGAVAFALVQDWHKTDPHLSYSVSKPNEVHILAGETRTLDGSADGNVSYIADSGSKVIVHRQVVDGPAAFNVPPFRITAKGGSTVEARGTAVWVVAEPGAVVTAFDGIKVDAYGARVVVYGNSTVHGLEGSVIIDKGVGSEVYVYKNATAYAEARGRVWAYDGSTVYAKSPEDCDACTQVVAYKGSTAHLFEGSECFAYGAFIYVYKGGEVHGAQQTTVWSFEGGEGDGAENTKNPDIILHKMPPESPQLDFKAILTRVYGEAAEEPDKP